MDTRMDMGFDGHLNDRRFEERKMSFDLESRMREKVEILSTMATIAESANPEEALRLKGKVEGLKLALSYLVEHQQAAPPA